MLETKESVNEFLAMFAHELGNPLATIRPLIAIIRAHKNDPAVTEWSCDIMERQVRQMSRLLEDLLDVSRITRGQIQLNKENTDLTALARESLDGLRIVLTNKNLTLKADFAEGPVPICADVTRIEQIIMNLVLNAAKFTPAGGQIIVRVQPDREFAVLRVIDSGDGIDPQVLPRIFQLFEQGDRCVARSLGGLGIGLALVQKLVLLHSGTIEARSAGRGRGSEFVVRLPMLPVTALKKAVEKPLAQALDSTST
jgi:signal transduction histidine kinase